MSNRELYKRSFHKLQPSEKLQKEIMEMMNDKSNRKSQPKKLLVLVAAVAAMLSLAVAASASNEAFRMVRVWINGEVPENGTVMYDMDGEDYIVEVDAQEGDKVDVIYSVDIVNPDELPVPSIVAEYENRDGADLLVFTCSKTGEVYELDITGELLDGSYAEDLVLFDCDCRVELTVDAEAVSLDFEVNGIHSVDFEEKE